MLPAIYLLKAFYPQPAEKLHRLMQVHNYRKGMKMPADPGSATAIPILLHYILW